MSKQQTKSSHDNFSPENGAPATQRAQPSEEQIDAIYKQVFTFGNLPVIPEPIALSVKNDLKRDWKGTPAIFRSLNGNEDTTLRGYIAEDNNDETLLLKVEFDSDAPRGIRKIILEQTTPEYTYRLVTIDDPAPWGSHLVIE